MAGTQSVHAHHHRLACYFHFKRVGGDRIGHRNTSSLGEPPAMLEVGGDDAHAAGSASGSSSSTTSISAAVNPRRLKSALMYVTPSSSPLPGNTRAAPITS